MIIGFIGLGNMASAMIGGILKQGIVKPADIHVASRTTNSVQRIVREYGVTPAPSDEGASERANKEVARAADILFLAVKPQMYPEVIAQIKDEVREQTLVVSIAPGKTLEWLTGLFGRPVKLARCMPNTPALVREGCTGVCRGALVTDGELEQLMTILKSFGTAYEVPEHLMDTVVGVSGSSPAYVFLFLEAMADAAVMDGMPRAQAYQFAAQAVLGSAKMVLETGKHPGELKDMVCSPGGTTIEAVRVLENKGFRSAVIEAQKACVEKSKGM